MQCIFLVLIPKASFLYVQWSLGAHKFVIRYEDD
jgi:hypothetical protein